MIIDYYRERTNLHTKEARSVDTPNPTIDNKISPCSGFEIIKSSIPELQISVPVSWNPTLIFYSSKGVCWLPMDEKSGIKDSNADK